MSIIYYCGQTPDGSNILQKKRFPYVHIVTKCYIGEIFVNVQLLQCLLTNFKWLPFGWSWRSFAINWYMYFTSTVSTYPSALQLHLYDTSSEFLPVLLYCGPESLSVLFGWYLCTCCPTGCVPLLCMVWLSSFS